MHGDAAIGNVDGVDPGQDEGDEDGFGAGGLFYGQERGGVFQAGAAIGCGGEFYVGDGADGDRSGIGSGCVVDGAAYQVSDEEGAGWECGELVGGDEELLTGEGFGGGDGVAAGELEDDAASVFAGGEPVLLDVEAQGVGRRGGGVGRREDDFARGGEEIREVAERVGEDLAAAALGTEQARDGEPGGGREGVQGDGARRGVGSRRCVGPSGMLGPGYELSAGDTGAQDDAET